MKIYFLVLILICGTCSGIFLNPGEEAWCWNDICKCRKPSVNELVLSCTCDDKQKSLEINATQTTKLSFANEVTEFYSSSCQTLILAEDSLSRITNLAKVHFSGIGKLVLRSRSISQLRKMRWLEFQDIRHLAAESETVFNVSHVALFVNNSTWPLIKNTTFNRATFQSISISNSTIGGIETHGLDFSGNLEDFRLENSSFGQLAMHSLRISAELAIVSGNSFTEVPENSTRISANVFEFHNNRISRIQQYGLYFRFYNLSVVDNTFEHVSELGFRLIAPHSATSLVRPEFRLIGNTFLSVDPHSLEIESRTSLAENLQFEIRDNVFVCECSPLQWLLQLSKRKDNDTYFSEVFETSVCRQNGTIDSKVPRSLKDFAKSALDGDGTCFEDRPNFASVFSPCLLLVHVTVFCVAIFRLVL